METNTETTKLETESSKYVMVVVSPLDFLMGEYVNNSGCPLALALKKMYPNKEIYVDPEVVKIDNSFYSLKFSDNEKLLRGAGTIDTPATTIVLTFYGYK